jgi:hypothetical protein
MGSGAERPKTAVCRYRTYVHTYCNELPFFRGICYAPAPQENNVSTSGLETVVVW